MGKLLEKALKDGVKEGGCTFGVKEVLRGIGDTKIIVVSRSLADENRQRLVQAAGQHDIPTIQFDGTSVALGKLCGLQFRVSAVSLDSLSAPGVSSIIKEMQ